MRRSDVTLTVALCLSLALHALVCVGAAERYIHGTRVWLPGTPVETLTTALYIDEPVPSTEDLQMRLGDAAADGTAIDASPGDDPMIARRGFQDQPFLSRDPVGPGEVGDEPTESTMLPGDGGAPAKSLAPQASPVAPPFGLGTARHEMENPFSPTAGRRPASPPEPDGDQHADAQATDRDGIAADASEQNPQPAMLSPAHPESPGANNGPLTAADPAAMGESEIDPTSANAPMGMDLRGGSTIARLGRKHRLTPRPRLNLAAIADLSSIRTGKLVLQIRIDAEGNVKHVQVVKSSGSESLDQTCKVAAYEWWFEPLKNASGQAIYDDFPFTIVF